MNLFYVKLFLKVSFNLFLTFTTTSLTMLKVSVIRCLSSSFCNECPWFVLFLHKSTALSFLLYMLPFLLIFFLIFCQNLAAGERVLYSLYGIVEHSGSMRGGHYTAYVKVRAPQRKTEQHHKNLSGQGLFLLNTFKTFYLFCVCVLFMKAASIQQQCQQCHIEDILYEAQGEQRPLCFIDRCFILSLFPSSSQGECPDLQYCVVLKSSCCQQAI